MIDRDQGSAAGTLTMLSNLIAADIDRLADSGLDQLLVGVQGVTPDSYAAFHPGWNEQQFFSCAATCGVLSSAGVTVRHVQVINRGSPPRRSGRHGALRQAQYGAERLNLQARQSLYGGTEDGVRHHRGAAREPGS